MEYKMHELAYSNEHDQPAFLSAEEASFFRQTSERIKQLLNIAIEIKPYNHDNVTGHENALGIYYRADDGSDMITIDNYFIHECYEVEHCGRYPIESETLTGAICHEIAHRRYLRHTKHHAALTQQYINAVSVV